MSDVVHKTRFASRTRAAMVVIFATAGTFHFLAPHRFTSIVPPWMPRADVLVALSGVAELAGAAGLVWARSRHWAGWGLIALLVAVFPANIQMLISNSGAPIWWQIVLWLRLPLQPLMMWLVWRAAISPFSSSAGGTAASQPRPASSQLAVRSRGRANSDERRNTRRRPDSEW